MLDTNVTAPRTMRIVVSMIIIGIIAVSAAGFGIYQRKHSVIELAAAADAQAIPSVAVVKPKLSSATRDLILPGRLEALIDSPIYARVSGYVKNWHVDIGTMVKKGTVLAEIDTPDLDAELAQAKAELSSAEANAKLAESTAKRWKPLLESDSVSQQAVDEKVADSESKQARVASAKANVARLEDIAAFKKVVAPFDGVITARTTDIGSLISAGTTGKELFHLADRSKLRLYVDVPQNHVASIRSQTTAELSVPELPGQKFVAKLANTSASIDPASGTILVQLIVDNPEGRLLPGSYAQVHFPLAAANTVLNIPATSLIMRSEGASVAIVRADNSAILKRITIERDLGATLDVGGDISTADQIIITPPDSLRNGDHVHIVTNS